MGQRMDSNNDKKLRIRVLGGMRWSYGERELPTSNKKLCALVSYLAMNDTLKLSRERIVGILWSETDETKARASLRQTIKQLRKLIDEIGFTGLLIDRDNIAFREGSCIVDVKNTIRRLDHLIVDDALLEGENIFEDCPSPLKLGH
jgi:DNA-binding SARP family transcriptional activator